MNLPQADHVEIARDKITDYLLSPVHPDGAGKAQFFGRMGFTGEQWHVLADALRQLASNCPVTQVVASPHGTKYIVDGALNTPSGKSPVLRTVWIIDVGAVTPRLVTAYPHDEGD